MLLVVHNVEHWLVIDIHLCVTIAIQQTTTHPNNQLHNRKGGGHYTLFSAMLSLQSIQLLWKIQAISIIANTATGKLHRAIVNRHLVLSVKRPGTQRRTKASP